MAACSFVCLAAHRVPPFAGHVDSKLEVTGSLQHPRVGGSVKLSRGTAYLNPPATTEASIAAEAGLKGRRAAGPAGPSGPVTKALEHGRQEDLVSRAFSAITSGSGSLAQQLSRIENMQLVSPVFKGCRHSRGQSTLEFPNGSMSPASLIFQIR